MQHALHINQLPVGASARILSYGIMNEFTERLQELGLTPGSLIRIVRRAPFSGPFEIVCGRTRLALRAQEGDKIYVERVEAA